MSNYCVREKGREIFDFLLIFWAFYFLFDFLKRSAGGDNIEKMVAKKWHKIVRGGWNSLSEWVKFIVFYQLGQCFLIAFTTLFDSFHIVKAMLLQRNMIAFTIQEKCLYWLSISYRLRNFARFSIYFTVAGFYRGDFKVAKIKV